MKNRKASKQQIAEDRNALYHKVILRNIELGKKNTELSHIIDYWKTKCDNLEEYINRKRWYQFWKWFK